MKKRLNIITVVVLMALTAVVANIITYYWVSNDFNAQLETYNKQKQELSAFYEALDRIDESFVGSTDRPVQVEGAIAGLVESLGDRWSHYWNAEDYRAILDSQSNQHVGIGVTVTKTDTALVIEEVMSGSPAEAAELAVGDRITHVDGAAVADVGSEGAVNMVLGKEYTDVTLTIERPSEGAGSFTVVIQRRTIAHETVTTRIYGSIGYVKIANFNNGVDDNFLELVGNLLDAGVTGLVFDVRNNPGGSLNVLVRILDYLLPEGDLITLYYKNGKIDPRVSGPDCIELPMTVLIDEDSISAAEFFAACLREYDYATLVGGKTTGKGYAQEHFRLSDGSGLYLSTSEYRTSKGVSLAETGGLVPDIEVPLTDSEKEFTGSMDPNTDRQLDRALRLLGWTPAA